MTRHVKIGSVEVGTTPRVVGVISAPLTLDRLASGFRPSCDIIELRVDLLGVGASDWLLRAGELEAEQRPVLLTIRSAAEGGRWFGTEAERAALLERVLPFVSAVDYEIRSPDLADMVRRVHDAGKVLLASFHAFNALPSTEAMAAVIAESAAAGADIIKIAALTRTEEELERLGSLLAGHRGPPLCLLGMGPMGPRSRTRLPELGSCLTYGFVDEANVPGQLSSEALMRHFRRASPPLR